MKLKFYHQLEYTDCGPTCIRIIASHYGKNYSLDEIRKYCEITRSGVTLNDVINGCKSIGLDSLAIKLSIDELVNDNLTMPFILHWRQEHFVVLYKIKKTSKTTFFYIADPAYGKLKIKFEDFNKFWKEDNEKGIILLIEKNQEFQNQYPLEKGSTWKKSWNFFKLYLIEYKNTIFKVSFLLLIASIFSLLFPITIQHLIDDGINLKKINIVWMVLLFQTLLFIGELISEWLRGILLINLGMKVSIKIIKQFLYKIIKLPIKFFDTRLYSDILQRIEDQDKIEHFITQSFIQSVFSFFLLIALSVQLAVYNFYIFLGFIILSILSVFWMLLFYHRREQINYTRFNLSSDNRNSLIELITGMTEIKINNAQNVKISFWEKIQEKLYRLQIQDLKLNQYQLIGVSAFSHLKNILSTFFCASLVINDEMTLGVMLSIGYILGQLDNPVQQLVNFFRSAQDAKISFDRMDEIQKNENENNESKISNVIINDLIKINMVSFKYEGSLSPYVLQNINVSIPKGKITAIVGVSGSGKTTLMKLLLNFYNPTNGSIMLDNIDMKNINSDNWRNQCGVVMQDGYIFSGTIAENIAVAENKPNVENLNFASKMACIDTFINTLPMEYNTKIGKSGIELSGGQKQRLLIARAIYKNPNFIFFDEATSALDAENEKTIHDNLQQFFKGKTVLIIAHRLSTVKNADQIIVLKNGEIVEIGNHQQLVQNKGDYFNLVKNQLELGN